MSLGTAKLEASATHTPGPWTVRKSGVSRFSTDGENWEDEPYPDHVVRIYRDSQGRRCTQYIALCKGAALPNDANANLIAAAPDLLQELEHICAEAESWHSMHHAQNLIQCDSICKAIPKMRAAIRKARGEAA
jgi:hypothetical protein